MKTANLSSAHRISIYPKFLGIPVVITPPRRRTTPLAWLFAALALSCLAPATAIAQVDEEEDETFPSTLTFPTTTGLTLRLDNKITSTDGKKIYYLVDANALDGNNDYDDLSHDDLDALLYDGANTLITQRVTPDNPDGHDGSDDERSVIIDGYALILPTLAELMTFGADTDAYNALPDNVKGEGDAVVSIVQTADRRSGDPSNHRFYNFATGMEETSKTETDRIGIVTLLQVRRAAVAFDIFIPNQTYPANTDIDLTLPTASGGILPLTYTLARINTGGFPGTLTFTGGTSTDPRFSGTTGAVYGTNGRATLAYTATDSGGTEMLSLTFTVTVVDVVAAAGTVSYYSDSNLDGALDVSNVSDVSDVDSIDIRIILPEAHGVETFTVTNYDLSADAAPPELDGITFSGVALEVVAAPGNITFKSGVITQGRGSVNAFPLTVCLSTAGMPGRAGTPSIYRLTTATSWGPDPIPPPDATKARAIVTNTPDDFVCGTTGERTSTFAVGYDTLSVDFDNTLGAQTYVVGQSVALTLPPTAAVDNMGMLTYTLTPTASIPDGLDL